MVSAAQAGQRQRHLALVAVVVVVRTAALLAHYRLQRAALQVAVVNRVRVVALVEQADRKAALRQRPEVVAAVAVVSLKLQP
jgi:hypothetical protein